MIQQHHVQQVKDICSNFLKDRGGLFNGYSTYIEGSTDLNSTFIVELPENINRTRREIEEISIKLKSEILNYLVQNNLNVIIKFIPKYVEYGSFDTYIEFTYPAGRLF